MPVGEPPPIGGWKPDPEPAGWRFTRASPTTLGLMTGTAIGLTFWALLLLVS